MKHLVKDLQKLCGKGSVRPVDIVEVEGVIGGDLSENS